LRIRLRKSIDLNMQTNKNITIKDVANLCGVSPAVISRVINNDPTLVIKDETRESVLRTVTELDYKPNYMARGLRTKKSGMVGLMLLDFTNPFSGQLIRGVQDALENSGMFCMLCETKEESDVERKWVELLHDRQIEGLIIATAKQNDPIISILEKLNIKYVMATRMTQNSNAPSVLYDTYKGISLAMEHLIKLGHTKIAHITGHINTTPGILRMQAYTDSLKKHGLPVRKEFITQANFLGNSGGEAMKDLLQLKECPTAVIACNDAVAISAIQTMKEAGFVIPRDISIIGYQNIPYSKDVDPPLTTIDTHTAEVGHKAAMMLLDLINGNELENDQVIIDVDLILRSSTGPFINKPNSIVL
jgi:LacI family transcriptional regulator